MPSAIRKGSVSESGLPLLPDRNRRGRGRTAGVSRLRDAPSSRVFRGEWRLHRIRLFESARGRAQDQLVRDRIVSGCGSRPARPGRTINAIWCFFYLEPIGTSCAGKRARASCARSDAPAAGGRHRGTSSSEAANPRSLRAVAAAGSPTRGATDEEPPGLCAAGSLSGNFRSAQFLCGVYTEGSFTALPHPADLLLRGRVELDLGDRGDLRRQQGLRRSGIHLKTEGQ